MNEISWVEITQIEKLHEIKPQWDSLNQAQNTFEVFNSPSWIFTWLKTFWQSNWHLKVLTAWENETLVAIVPLYYQQKSFLSLKTLYPLGQGEAEAKEISSEYVDILINGYDQDNAQVNTALEIRSKIVQWIQNLKTDQFIWDALSSTSTAKDIITTIGAKSTISPATQYIVDCQTWSADKLSKNMRSRYRRGINQLNKLDAKIDWVQKENFDKYWQIMKEFHQARWRNKNKKGAFCCDEFNRFHTEFRKESPKNIAMSAIWVNGAPIAIHYYFVDPTTLYFYQSGWDEAEYSNLSPGLILHLWSIENNIKPFYDFMMGKKQGSYKAKFATIQQPMHNAKINFSPIKSIAYRVLKKTILIKK
jgi:CelD/BcsL family acetyltransferase involved in cellulose biosynthesis